MKPSCCSSFHPSGLLTLMLELTNHAALHTSSYSSSVLNQESQLSSLCALCSFTATRANLGWNTFSPHLLFPVLILFAVHFVLVHTQPFVLRFSWAFPVQGLLSYFQVLCVLNTCLLSLVNDFSPSLPFSCRLYLTPILSPPTVIYLVKSWKAG